MIIFALAAILFPLSLIVPIGYSFLVFISSLILNRNLKVAFLSIPASWIQLFGYGLGFIEATWKRLVLGKKEFKAFEKNFYS
jgi:hypothetical protein